MSDAIRLEVSDITVGPRFRRELGDLTALADSIESVGLLHPIVVTPEFELVAGRRRLEACKRIGWVDIPCRVLPLNPVEMLMAEHDENEVRRDFTPTERVAIGRAMEESIRERAAERQRAGVNLSKNFPKVPSAERGRSADIVGSKVGMSGPTYSRAKAVVVAAEDDPAKYGDLAEAMDTTGKVTPAYRELQSRKEGNAPSNQNKPRLMPIAAAGQIVRNVSNSLHAAVTALEKVDTDGGNEIEVAGWISDLEDPLRQIRKVIRSWKERGQCAS